MDQADRPTMDRPAPDVTTGAPAQAERLSGLRRVLDRLTAANADLEAKEQAARAAAEGGTPVDCLRERSRATVCGVVRCTTTQPRDGQPALAADVFDGTGTVTVVWLGRRTIAGVEPGRRIRVEGLVCARDEARVLYNPRYELLPPSA